MSSTDLYERAERFYQTRLRTDLERAHLNSFVAIEPESGTFFLGRTLSEAYTSFKGFYNWSYTMNLVTFMLTAARYCDFQYSYLTSPSDMARTVGGIILVVLNIWSYKATLNAVGLFGWFFGDFFVAEPFQVAQDYGAAKNVRHLG